jgi:hypothetical protein
MEAGTTFDHRLYAAYLNEHLLGSEGGYRAFLAAADTWRGTEHEAALHSLAEQVGADQRDLIRIIEQLGYRQSPVKHALAGAVRAVGRINPVNLLRSKKGGLTQVELDVLVGMVRAKGMMWETLSMLSDADPRLDRALLADLSSRTEDQIRQLQEINAKTCLRRFTTRGHP